MGTRKIDALDGQDKGSGKEIRTKEILCGSSASSVTSHAVHEFFVVEVDYLGMHHYVLVGGCFVMIVHLWCVSHAACHLLTASLAVHASSFGRCRQRATNVAKIDKKQPPIPYTGSINTYYRYHHVRH